MIPDAKAGTLPQVRQVLEFWLGDALSLGWPSQSRSELWFGGGAALDRQIEASFGDLVREAVAGGLLRWEVTPLDRLALVLLLDQFTRNVFRGSAEAFRGDPRALALALDTMDRGWDSELPLAGRTFLMLPLSHAESLAMQDLAVSYISRQATTASKSQAGVLDGHVKSALEHRDIIAEFGRFPHRNATLGRISTPAEEAWLVSGKRFGQ